MPQSAPEAIARAIVLLLVPNREAVKLLYRHSTSCNGRFWLLWPVQLLFTKVMIYFCDCHSALMKECCPMVRFPSVCMAAFILFAAVPSLANAPDKRDALAAEVERAIVMPNGAQPIAAYGRNYALTDQGMVVAKYIIPERAPDLKEECTRTTGGTRPCSKTEIAELKAKYDRIHVKKTPAGSRRWFDSPREIPVMFDGGCRQVNVEYDPTTHRMLRLTCNGFA